MTELSPSAELLLEAMVETARRLNPADPTRVCFIEIKVGEGRVRIYAQGIRDDAGEVVTFPEPVLVVW